MNTNPDHTPTEKRAASPRQFRPQSVFAQHQTAIFVIMGISGVVAMLVTPADPFSMVLATVPIFGMLFSAYWIGFQQGIKQSRDDRRDEE